MIRGTSTGASLVNYLVEHNKTTDPMKSLFFLQLDKFLERLPNKCKVGLHTDWSWHDIYIIESILLSVPDGTQIIAKTPDRYVQTYLKQNCKDFIGSKPIFYAHEAYRDWLANTLFFVEDCDAIITMSSRDPLPREVKLIHQLAHSTSTLFTLYR